MGRTHRGGEQILAASVALIAALVLLVSGSDASIVGRSDKSMRGEMSWMPNYEYQQVIPSHHGGDLPGLDPQAITRLFRKRGSHIRLMKRPSNSPDSAIPSDMLRLLKRSSSASSAQGVTSAEAAGAMGDMSRDMVRLLRSPTDMLRLLKKSEESTSSSEGGEEAQEMKRSGSYMRLY